jgi:hypothetical protein
VKEERSLAINMDKRRRALTMELDYWFHAMDTCGDLLPRRGEVDGWTREELTDVVRRCRNSVDAVRLCAFAFATLDGNNPLDASVQSLIDVATGTAVHYINHANEVETNFWMRYLKT